MKRILPSFAVAASFYLLSSLASAESIVPPAPAGNPEAPSIAPAVPPAPQPVEGEPIRIPVPASTPVPPPTALRDTIYVAQPPLPPLQPRSRHYHDGFYLRLSLGLGLLRASSSADSAGYSSKASGSGTAIDILVGGTPTPGLVVGGGLLLQEAFNPSYDESLGTLTLHGRPNPSSSLGFGMLGPMIDLFPNPAGGFHVGALIGLSQVGLRDPQGNRSGGLGVSAWAGYMWWASSEWSVGGLVRLSAAWSGRTLGDGANGTDVQDATRAITFMFSTAYH